MVDELPVELNTMAHKDHSEQIDGCESTERKKPVMDDTGHDLFCRALSTRYGFTIIAKATALEHLLDYLVAEQWLLVFPE